MPEPTPAELQAQIAALEARLAAQLHAPPSEPPPQPLAQRVAAQVAEWREVLAPYNNRIRTGMYFTAGAIVAGYPPPFGDIAAVLGKWGWFGSLVLASASFWLKSTPSMGQIATRSSDIELCALGERIATAQAKNGGTTP